MIKREYLQKHKVLKFKFFQNERDFIVEELPIKFTGRGNFIIAKIKKKNIGTWELLEILSKNLRIYEYELGYAGLKDKNATTTQYISIPKKYSKELKKFKHPKIEIQNTVLHSSRLNIGDLKANSFKINLHEVEQKDLVFIEKILKQLVKIGMPNYFGFQRFGKDYEQNLGKAIKYIHEDLSIKNRKLAKMLVSMYQSDFFNKWLVRRIQMSEDSFKIIDGDVFKDYAKDRFFTPKILNEKIENDYKNKKIVPTGLLPGKVAFRSIGKAREIEKNFDDEYIGEKGYRRDAIVYPKDINISYDTKTKICRLEFVLPKGSYATVLIENIANKNLRK